VRISRTAHNRNVGVGFAYNGAMAWDTEGTRRRLKEAATAEFAEHGPDGTTMTRIAERAGINKERLYKYFTDKDTLFATVLADELAKLAASVPPFADGFEGGLEGGLADIGEYAGRTFDYYGAHPELARLLLWEGLAGGPVADEANRTVHYQRKVQAFADAQHAGVLADDLDAAHLVFLIIGLAAWWFSAPQLARMLTGADDGDPAEHARRRAFVVRAAERLALRRTRAKRPEGMSAAPPDGTAGLW
jgi:AcrR family transcriptional regulator